MEDFKKVKIITGRKQQRIEELGETWLRRRKPTKGCMPNDDDPVCEAILQQKVIFAIYREKTVLSCGVWTDKDIQISV
jgi:hypothetical protein